MVARGAPQQDHRIEVMGEGRVEAVDLNLEIPKLGRRLVSSVLWRRAS
jgi:hypothetical protein